jgi:deoxyinosine 3'endonuclease (endonuclease V)
MDYWRALRNEYWPAIYVVDGRGQIRERLFGEVHVGTGRDKAVSGLVEKLLDEAAVPER